MKAIKFIILSGIFLFQIELSAQNTIWLTNGKKINSKEFKISSTDFIEYKNLKGKSKVLESFDVFSVTDSTGKEQIIYFPDSAFKDAFTIPEMRSFVQGQYDAEMKFKSPWTTVGGIAVAGASSAVINPVYVFLISTGYCSAIGITKPWKKNVNIPAEFSGDEHYILGYTKATKHKRIKNAIIGSGIGLIVGLGTFAIISNN